MKKKEVVIIILSSFVVILFGFVLFLLGKDNSKDIPNVQEFTYDACLDKVVEDAHFLAPASEEEIGATRVDEYGRTWVKVKAGYWENDQRAGATGAADEMIDNLYGGVNSPVKDFTECEKYRFVRLVSMEIAIQKIIEEENYFSIKEIEINNINGVTKGDVFLTYKKNLSLTDEVIIMKKIGNTILENYQKQFLGEDSLDSMIVFDMEGIRKWGIVGGDILVYEIPNIYN